MSENTQDDLVPKLVWLSKPERRVAIRAYNEWLVRADKNLRTRALPRQRVALSCAYIVVASVWMIVWIPLIMAAALSLNHAAQAGSAFAAVPPVALSLVRVFQGYRACPEAYRLPPRNRSRGGSNTPSRQR